jgi:hypothetical protein
MYKVEARHNMRAAAEAVFLLRGCTARLIVLRFVRNSEQGIGYAVKRLETAPGDYLLPSQA